MANTKFNQTQTIEKLSDLFREHGYHGTTFTYIQEASGLGKGSLYHHFANGKEDIAKAVLERVNNWFEENVYKPLENPDADLKTIDKMFEETVNFFHKGSRVCVPGSFALHDSRDIFPELISVYFTRWIDSLSVYLKRMGFSKTESEETALDTVSLIQGALVMARALNDNEIFLKRLKRNQILIKKLIKEK
jgi:TetR/AcrR family transcriptional regulator, lmrAB and yxaGH operons repressor